MMQEDLLKIYADCFKDNYSLPALSEYGTKNTLTYGDFARRIAHVHLLFEKLGIKPGDKVALMGKNSSNWVTVFMATITYGAVIVPILQEFNPTDAQHIVNHSDAVALIISDSLWENFEFGNLRKLRTVFSLDSQDVIADRNISVNARNILRELPELFAERYHDGFRPEDIRYSNFPTDSVAVINYTSGTTGFSKGVMLTLNNLCGNVVFGIRSQLHYKGSRCLSFLPLAHAYGCAFDLLTPLAVGSHVTLFGRLPAPKPLLKALSEVKPTLILCVPLILEKIYRKQILPIISKPTVRSLLMIPLIKQRIYARICRRLVEAFGGEFEQVIVGGAPLNPEVEEFLYKIKFPFSVGYGMTECGPLISFTPWREFIPRSSGRTLQGFMYSKIISDNEATIPGEICVKGENLMKGYYKNEKATKEAIDGEGWLHTGDMGTISDAGTIFIKGRYKTMILTANGQNIYPEEIEAKLNNMPYVAESLVVERGKKLVALVYPDFDAMDKAGITLDSLQPIMEQTLKELNSRTAPYERIDNVELLASEFQKTPKRSIKRYLYH
ncbi:MAG: AMP-binding protein [Paramuribaculum sp.]|nr:AMP-binding protein [Paramuribaculum sp.]